MSWISFGMILSILKYLSVDSSEGPEMISGVRASSMRMESTSSTMAELVAALNALRQVVLHVVAQVVEAEFVVRAVGDVGAVGRAALLVVQIMHDHADGQAQSA